MRDNHSRVGDQRIALVGQVRLAELEPNLLRFVARDDRDSFERLTVPVLDVSKRSLAITELLEQRAAFAAIVVQGMLLDYLQIGAQPGLRLLGPGDLVTARPGRQATPLGTATCRTAEATQLALLGNEVLLAVRRSPRLLIGLQTAVAEQMERMGTQLVICQLPRVEDRILAMLWLLADSFGRVTSAGTTLPLSLTHELLGALVGARRPTVTLALGELAGRGALVQQDRGWLLLEAPPPPVDAIRPLEEPRLLEQMPSKWAVDARPAWDPGQTLAALSETVSGLREQHLRIAEQVRARLSQTALAREQTVELRKRIHGRRVSRGGRLHHHDHSGG
jgi:CRP/FNR family cyclic AMP-dependent transcriptional regulator